MDKHSSLFKFFISDGEKKFYDTVTSCKIAELFLALSVTFSSSLSLTLCSPTQWLTNDDDTPNDSLHTKHMRIGFTGTVELSTIGTSEDALDSSFRPSRNVSKLFTAAIREFSY